MKNDPYAGIFKKIYNVNSSKILVLSRPQYSVGWGYDGHVSKDRPLQGFLSAIADAQHFSSRFDEVLILDRKITHRKGITNERLAAMGLNNVHVCREVKDISCDALYYMSPFVNTAVLNIIARTRSVPSISVQGLRYYGKHQLAKIRHPSDYETIANAVFSLFHDSIVYHSSKSLRSSGIRSHLQSVLFQIIHESAEKVVLVQSRDSDLVDHLIHSVRGREYCTLDLSTSKDHPLGLPNKKRKYITLSGLSEMPPSKAAEIVSFLDAETGEDKRIIITPNDCADFTNHSGLVKELDLDAHPVWVSTQSARFCYQLLGIHPSISVIPQHIIELNPFSTLLQDWPRKELDWSRAMVRLTYEEGYRR